MISSLTGAVRFSRLAMDALGHCQLAAEVTNMASWLAIPQRVGTLGWISGAAS